MEWDRNVMHAGKSYRVSLHRGRYIGKRYGAKAYRWHCVVLSSDSAKAFGVDKRVSAVECVRIAISKTNTV